MLDPDPKKMNADPQIFPFTAALLLLLYHIAGKPQEALARTEGRGGEGSRVEILSPPPFLSIYWFSHYFILITEKEEVVGSKSVNTFSNILSVSWANNI